VFHRFWKKVTDQGLTVGLGCDEVAWVDKQDAADTCVIVAPLKYVVFSVNTRFVATAFLSKVTG
jgi:hypothetical protein